MLYLSTVLLSVFITVSLIPLLMLLADRYQLLVDYPDSRKVHTRPVPRIGGLATALGASMPVILWTTADGFVRAYLAGAGVLVAFGLLDDFRGLGYKTKFTGQIIAALVIVLYGGVRIGSIGTLLPERCSCQNGVQFYYRLWQLSAQRTQSILPMGWMALRAEFPFSVFAVSDILPICRAMSMLFCCPCHLRVQFSDFFDSILIRQVFLWAIRVVSFSVFPRLSLPLKSLKATPVSARFCL